VSLAEVPVAIAVGGITVSKSPSPFESYFKVTSSKSVNLS
jgi:hypothetical protein